MGLGRGIGRGVVLATALAALALPAGASAATQCTKSGTNLGITLNLDGDQASISVIAGDEIEVRGSGGTLVPCSGGPATLTNIDTVNVTQAGTIRGSVSLFIPAGGFGPGATLEPAGKSEIEVVVDLGNEVGGQNDTFDFGSLLPDNDLDSLRFGSLAGGGTGGNLNLPEPGAPDGDDIKLIDVEQFQASTGVATLEFGAKTLDASGGPEFTGPVTESTPTLRGADGPDTLVGANTFSTLIGNGGDDLVVSSPGTDLLRGDAGNDTVSYARATAGVTVNLATTGFQLTGGGGQDDLDSFVNLSGSPFGDTVTGTGDGNDVNGRGGNDTLSLALGNDTFDALDNGPDTVDCGDGADSGVSDEVGVDTLTGCENVNFVPSTSVVSGPAEGGLTNDATPSFGLTANEAATFEYRVDGGAFTACPAECETTALGDGQHQVEFRATDSTALVEQTPVARTVAVDTAAPETQIDSGPADGSTIATASPSYAFSSEPGTSFECAVDSGAFSGCTSPNAFGGLADGNHTVAVRAVDAAGNADPSPASRSLSVDTKTPKTTVKKPKVKGSNATLKFSADERSSSFECKLDKGKFRACESPKKYKKLDKGKHKFFVVATDAAGNEEEKAAKAKFEVG